MNSLFSIISGTTKEEYLLPSHPLYPGFAGFALKRRKGHYPGSYHKTWDIGSTNFQYHPCLRKTWNIGSTDFQYHPCLENVEYWGQYHPCLENVGYWGQYHPCSENVGYWGQYHPCSENVGYWEYRHNHGIMIRFHVCPRDLWERCSPRTSKTVLGTLRFARVPRTVFEVLGLHLSQGPSEKRGILAQD